MQEATRGTVSYGHTCLTNAVERDARKGGRFEEVNAIIGERKEEVEGSWHVLFNVLRKGKPLISSCISTQGL